VTVVREKVWAGPVTRDRPQARECLDVALVETAPPEELGSMRRYADMVTQAFAAAHSGGAVRIRRINLALRSARSVRLPAACRTWLHHAGVTVSARRRLGRCRADVFHIIDGSHAYVAKWLPRAPAVATSHDVIPLLQLVGRLGGRRPRWPARRLVKRSIEALQRVDQVVAGSHNTARDLRGPGGVDPGRVTVVHCAVSPRMAGKADSAAQPRGEPHRPGDAYVLHVGHNAFYKNRAGVLRIFGRIRSSCETRLKMVGAPPGRELRDLVRDLGLARHVDFIVNPDDAELAALYRRARLLLFPSLYEGFGWPPLEAMALGCPVVCSCAASLPEIVGRAALTCAPEDERQMASHCIIVLQSPSVAARLVQRGYARAGRFTLQRMADGLTRAYMKAIWRGPEG